MYAEEIVPLREYEIAYRALREAEKNEQPVSVTLRDKMFILDSGDFIKYFWHVDDTSSSKRI